MDQSTRAKSARRRSPSHGSRALAAERREAQLGFPGISVFAAAGTRFQGAPAGRSGAAHVQGRPTQHGRVVTGDHEGNRCDGTVVGVEPSGVVAIELDHATLVRTHRPAPADR